jgi:hypothetical protein
MSNAKTESQFQQWFTITERADVQASQKEGKNRSFFKGPFRGDSRQNGPQSTTKTTPNCTVLHLPRLCPRNRYRPPILGHVGEF